MANKGPADGSSLDPIRTNPSSQGYKHASGLSQNRVESTMTRALVFEVTNAPTHTTAGIVADPTPSVGVHNLVSEPICTPLRPQNFARYLSTHPDKAVVQRLLHGIQYSFDIGYGGPVAGHTSPNLASAHAHPDVIDAHLRKECKAGRIAGPFPAPPLQSALGWV